MDNTEAITKAMQLFLEEFGNKFVISPERIEMWQVMFRAIPGGIILAAAYHLCSDGREWSPTVGMLRNTALDMMDGRMHPPSGTDAWEKIQMLIQQQDVELTDIEKQALRQTGALCDLRRSSNPASDRATFCKAFDSLVKRQDADRQMLPEVKRAYEENRPRQIEASKAKMIKEG